jgi:methyl-accepting chemotaxis protein
MKLTGKKFLTNFLSIESIGFGIGLPVAIIYGMVLSPVFSVYGNFTASLLKNASIVGAVVVLFIALPTSYSISKNISLFIDRWNNKTFSSQEVQTFFIKLQKLPFLHGLWIFSRIFAGAIVVALLIKADLNADVYSTLTIILLALHGAFLAGFTANIVVLKLIRPLLIDIIKANILPQEFITRQKMFGLPLLNRTIIFLLTPLFIETLSLILVFKVLSLGHFNSGDLMFNLIAMVLINFILLSILVLIYYSQIKTSIASINHSMSMFLSESGDLTRTIDTTLDDDISYLGYLYNRITGNISGLIREVKIKTKGVSGRITGIFDPLYLIVSSSSVTYKEAQNILDKTSLQKKLVDASIDYTVGMQKNIDELRKFVFNFKDLLQYLLKDTDSLLEKLLKLKDDSGHFLESIDKGIQNVTSISGYLNTIFDANDQVKSTASEINQIIAIIEDIANQTNILSMNASIEASHAGQFGRGFSVVAKEIKKLANLSRDSARNSASQINNLINSIENNTSVSNSAISQIKTNLEVFEQVKEFYLNLNKFFEEQGQISSKLRVEITTILDKMNQLIKLVEDQQNFVNSTINNIKNVGQSSDEINDYLDKMVKTLDGLVKNVQESMGNLDGTRKVDEELLEMVNKFKIQE